MAFKVLKIKQVRSQSKLKPKQRLTLKALGLRGLGSEVVRKDLRAVRGMLNGLQHVVTAEQLEGPITKQPKKSEGQQGLRVGKA